MNNTTKTVPLKDGLYEFSEGKAYLIGSICAHCGEIIFPRKDNSFCPHCQHESLQDVRLSNRGKIITFAVVHQPPAGGFYKGSVPFAYGVVELPEGVYVETLFTGCGYDQLKTGLDAELTIEELFEDNDGTKVVTYKFVPKI